MAENFVQIKVKASDTAKPDLTSLQAQLDDIGAKVENARVSVDDEDGKAKLLDFNARLAALNAKVANPKISLAGAARAEAQIAALDTQLRKSSDDSAGAKTRFGGLGQAVNALTLGLSGGIGEMSVFQKVMLGLNVATGIGEPLMAGLTVAVAGLASGLVAAGGAAGAFGLLAKSNLTAAATAATAAQSAQTQYSSAVTAANAAYEQQMKTATTATARKNAETARATALQSAYKAQVQATTAAYAQLTPAQVQLSRQVGAIQNQWQKFTASFAGPTSAIVGQLRPLVTSLLPDISKLAMAGETGISSLLTTVGAAGTGGLGKFVNMLAVSAPAAIMRLAVAVGHVATGIGGILKAFMPVQGQMLTGLDSITAKFAQWGQTLTSHSGFQSLMSMFRDETPMAVHALEQLATLIKTVVSQMTGMSTFSNSKMLLQMVNPLLAALNQLAKVPGLVSLVLYLKLAADAGGKLKTAFSGIGDGLTTLKTGVANLRNLRSGFADADAAASGATGAWGTFGGKVSSVLKGTRQGFSDFTSGFNDSSAAASEFSGKWGSFGGTVRSVFSSVGSAATSAWSAIASGAASAWSGVTTGVSTAVEAVKSWSIWSKIAAAATRVWTAVQAAFDVVMDANPIGIIIIAIAALVAAIVILTIKFKAMRDFWKAAWADIKMVALDVFHALEPALKAYVTFWKLQWDVVKTVGLAAFRILEGAVKLYVAFWRVQWDIAKTVVVEAWRLIADYIRVNVDAIKAVLAWFGRLGSLFRGWWDDAANAVDSGISRMLSFVGSIPGKIMGALAALPGLLFSAGAHIIDSLASGIMSRIGSVAHAISSVVSEVTAHLPFSPAKKVPLSGSGSPDLAGRRIAHMLGQGMTAGLPSVSAAASRMAGAAGIGGQGSAGGGGRGVIQLQIAAGGGGQFEQFLALMIKQYVRAVGGGGPYSVQRAYGRTVPAG
jgi:phage-related protein